jgi:hypothetical protein
VSLPLALTTALALAHTSALAQDERFDTRLPKPAESALAKPDSVELLSLDPRPREGGAHFHYTGVLGRTVLKDTAARAKLIKALLKGIEAGPEPARCFDPHHGLRVKAGNQTFDLVICFHCRQINVYDPEKLVALVLVDGAPAEAFDAALRAAGLPVP